MLLKIINTIFTGLFEWVSSGVSDDRISSKDVLEQSKWDESERATTPSHLESMFLMAMRMILEGSSIWTLLSHQLTQRHRLVW